MTTPVATGHAAYTQAERNAIRDATLRVLCKLAIDSGPFSAVEAIAKFASHKEAVVQAV